MTAAPAGGIAGSRVAEFGEGFGLAVVGVIFTVLVVYGYQGIFEGLWEGQTPGKKEAHTRVESDLGQPVTGGRWPSARSPCSPTPGRRCRQAGGLP